MLTTRMQDDTPLVVTRCIEYAARYHGDTEVVSRLPEGGLHRTCYAEVALRSKAFAMALQDARVKQGERICTLAWNTHRHLECWYGIMGIGAVCHTLNPRLFDADLEYIINDAEDTVLIADITFAEAVDRLAPKLRTVRRYVFLCPPDRLPAMKNVRAESYEALLARYLPSAQNFVWPDLDERLPCGLCYTSGTTGRPKGVLYSHRSNVLHALMIAMPDCLGMGAADSALPVVPMFHANSWGMAFAAPIAGSRLVMPAGALDGQSVYELMRDERVTHTAGVPTVWLALQAHMEAGSDRHLPDLKVIVVGGAACPRKLIDFFWEQEGIDLRQAWGMTETSPLGTVGAPKWSREPATVDTARRFKMTQGRPHFFAELRIIDDEGKELPWDGKAFGELQIRGPIVLQSYFKKDEPAVDGDRWFSTGDVSFITPEGYMQITDRSKDVIKSGGEWISSIEIENVAVGHPQLAETAVIAVPHPKWTERPLLVAVAKPGQNPSKQDVLNYLQGKIAKWWMPDDVVFVKEIPHTATGKISKLTLRKQLGGYSFGPASKL